MKEVPLDPSLLAQGAKDYGTHRLRRRGLPTHVPQDWLGQHPAAVSGHCSPVKSEVGNFVPLKSLYAACNASYSCLHCCVGPQGWHIALTMRNIDLCGLMHAGAELLERQMQRVHDSLALQQAAGDFSIKAARPNCSTQPSQVIPALPGSGRNRDLGNKGCDSSYSYAFPSTDCRWPAHRDLHTLLAAASLTVLKMTSRALQKA